MSAGSELVVFDGGALKALGHGKVGGYGVYFTSELQPDLDGEFFTAETNFELQDRTSLPLYFGHGVDPTMQKRKLGKATFKQDGEGVWVETQLDLRDRWLKKIYDLITQGKLSYSSGAISHLVEKVQKGAATWLKTWPIGEMSFTPCPAAPFGTEVKPLKSYHAPSLKETIRRAGLTDWQLFREESERTHDRILATLEGKKTPETWGDDQTMRYSNSDNRRAAQRDWIEMRDQAKVSLDSAEKLLAEVTALRGKAHNEVREERTKHFRPGHNCTRQGCWTAGHSWPYAR